MVDMAITEQEKKEMISVPSGPPKYPYGLRITLGPEELEKLGLDIPEVDAKLKIKAEVKVAEVSSEDERGDVPSHRVVLQITDIELDKEKSSEEAIYGV